MRSGQGQRTSQLIARDRRRFLERAHQRARPPVEQIDRAGIGSTGFVVERRAHRYQIVPDRDGVSKLVACGARAGFQQGCQQRPGREIVDVNRAGVLSRAVLAERRSNRHNAVRERHRISKLVTSHGRGRISNRPEQLSACQVEQIRQTGVCYRRHVCQRRADESKIAKDRQRLAETVSNSCRGIRNLPQQRVPQHGARQSHLIRRSAIGAHGFKVREFSQACGIGNLRKVERKILQFSETNLRTRSWTLTGCNGVAGQDRKVNDFVAGQIQRAHARGEFKAGNIREMKPVQVEPCQRGQLGRGDLPAREGHAVIRNRNRHPQRLRQCPSQRIFVNVGVHRRIQRLELTLTRGDALGQK